MLITGATRGIGKAIALRLAAQQRKCFPLELRKLVRVTLLIAFPYTTWTEETETRHGYRDPERLHAKEAQMPLKRIGTPEEVAEVVAFLLAPEARYINGKKILVAGGEFMW